MSEDERAGRAGRVRKKSAKLLEMEEFEQIEKKEVKKVSKPKASPAKKGRKGAISLSNLNESSLTLGQDIDSSPTEPVKLETSLPSYSPPAPTVSPKVGKQKVNPLMAGTDIGDMPPSKAELAAMKQAGKKTTAPAPKIIMKHPPGIVPTLDDNLPTTSTPGRGRKSKKIEVATGKNTLMIKTEDDLSSEFVEPAPVLDTVAIKTEIKEEKKTQKKAGRKSAANKAAAASGLAQAETAGEGEGSAPPVKAKRKYTKRQPAATPAQGTSEATPAKKRRVSKKKVDVDFIEGIEEETEEEIGGGSPGDELDMMVNIKKNALKKLAAPRKKKGTNAKAKKGQVLHKVVEEIDDSMEDEFPSDIEDEPDEFGDDDSGDDSMSDGDDIDLHNDSMGDGSDGLQIHGDNMSDDEDADVDLDDDDEDIDDDDDVGDDDDNDADIDDTDDPDVSSGATASAPPIYSNTSSMAMKYMTSAERKAQSAISKKAEPKKNKTKQKRAPTAYMVWCNSVRPRLIKDNPSLDFVSLSRRLGEMWHGVSEKEKTMWRRKANREGKKAKEQMKAAEELKPKAETIVKANKSKPIMISTTKSGSGRGFTVKNISPHAIAAVKAATTATSSSVNPSIAIDASSAEAMAEAAMKELNNAAFKVTNTTPLDMAAHLKLLGESLSIIGARLQEHQGPIAVQGSLSVLLDSMICSLGPLMCLTMQVPEMNSCPARVHTQTMDNIAYIMPGIG